MLAIVVIIGIFAGCGSFGTPAASSGSLATTEPGTGPVPSDVASPFTLYRISDGLMVKLGDKREDVAKVLGPDEFFVFSFEEEFLERVQYWDYELVAIDYDVNGGGLVRAIRVEDPDWKIFNGIGIGSSRKDVRQQYGREYMFSYPQNEDIWVCYDENGQLIEFDENAAYIVRFRIKDDKTEMILIQDSSY